MAASVLAGCTANRHVTLDPTQAHWFEYESNRRGAVMWPYHAASGQFVKFCAEPAPDIALARSLDAVVHVQTPAGVSGDAQVKYNREVVAMAGRTATLLALREMLYRLCEMQMNNVLTQQQAAPLYERTLDAMLKLANAELAQTIKTAPTSTLPAITEALQTAPVVSP